jgi:glycosyltransferase involved in cell wall biosynthesis
VDPLVTIVVRSMGRPELAGALACLAAQDHAPLDVVVVDATGGSHPPLPDVAWRDGHRVRVIGGSERLNRTAAANAGLDAVRGEFFGYLDDDDACEPTHVSTLVRAAREHPDALAVYGRAQWLRPDGTLERLHGLPFNRMLLFHGPIMCWQAALFRRRVVELGCRFRPEFDRMEDRDFVAQVADRGELVMIDAATFRFRPDLGTSGTGRGANDDRARSALIDLRLRDAWFGAGTFHTARTLRFALRAQARFAEGRLDEARVVLDAGLAEYPEDPNMLHGLALVALARGDLDPAEDFALRALAVHAGMADVHATLARIRAARDARILPFPSATVSAPATPGRLAACPCGSGLRYKACCGRVDDRRSALREASPPPHDESAIRDTARALDTAAPAEAAASLCRLAAAALDAGHDELALELASRALATSEDPSARRLFETAGERVGRPAREASLRDFARRFLEHRGPAVPVSGRVHIVGDFRDDKPDRATAAGVKRDPRWSEAYLWYTESPAGPIEAHAVHLMSALRAPVMRGDTFILLVGSAPPGEWLDALAPGLVIVHHDGRDAESMVVRLAQVDASHPRVPIAALPEP